MLAYKDSKVTTKNGKKVWCIRFSFTNNNSKAVYFSESFYYMAYINGVEISAYDISDNIYTSIKNGASLDVEVYYSVSSGDKFQFEIADTNSCKVFFTKVLTIK